MDKEGRDLIVDLSLSSLFCSESHSGNGQHLGKENPEMSELFEEKLGIHVWELVPLFDKDMAYSWVGSFSLMI